MKFFISAFIGIIAAVGATASAQTPYDIVPSGDDVTEEHLLVIKNEAAIIGGAIGLSTGGCGTLRQDWTDTITIFMDTWNNSYGTGDRNDVIPTLVEWSTPMAAFFLELSRAQGCTAAVAAFMQLDMLIEAEGADSPTVQFGMTNPSITGTVMTYIIPRSL